jgi:hypothetical protein
MSAAERSEAIRLCAADVSRLARLASLGSLGGPNAAERSEA